jgi:hypothetical protein
VPTDRLQTDWVSNRNRSIAHRSPFRTEIANRLPVSSRPKQRFHFRFLFRAYSLAMLKSLKKIQTSSRKGLPLLLLVLSWLGLEPSPSAGQSAQRTPPNHGLLGNLVRNSVAPAKVIPSSTATAGTSRPNDQPHRLGLAAKSDGVDQTLHRTFAENEKELDFPAIGPLQNAPIKLPVPSERADSFRLQPVVWESRVADRGKSVDLQPATGLAVPSGRLEPSRPHTDWIRSADGFSENNPTANLSGPLQPAPAAAGSAPSKPDMFSSPPMPEDIRSDR